MPHILPHDRCLPPETLRQFLANELSQELEASVLSHLETCPTCQELCDSVARSDQFQGVRSKVARLEQVEAAGLTELRNELYALDDTAAQAGQSDTQTQAYSPTSVAGDLPRSFGGYELLEEIARGGMGVVYKARQTRLDRIVAVKMILAGEFASADGIRRFMTEAQAAANLDHPHIVPIYEVGECEGRHFYSMGYIEGQSLAKLVAQGPLPPREAAELMRKIAEAVQYAHSKGVIHRDLKPGNILLSAECGTRNAESLCTPNSELRTSPESLCTPNSELRTSPESLRTPHSELRAPKITDFGLAKRVQGDSELTSTGQVLGTPSYMPPEQARGEATIGPLADIYSLGAILYCLLTGRPPFQTASVMETLKQVLETDPLPPRQLNPDIPRDLETIALKCLEKSPDRRYRTAQALAEELDRYLHHRPILARPVSRPERAWRWCKRNPIGSLAVGLLLAVAFGASTAFVRESELRQDIEQKERTTRKALTAETQAKNAETAAKQRETAAKNLANQKAIEAKEKREKAEFEQARAEKELLRAEWLLYATQLTAAQRAWEANDADEAWKHLYSTRNDFRGWEFDYLYTLFAKRQLPVHRGLAVHSVAFSPDGKWIAGGVGDGPVKIWDTATRQEVGVLNGHTAAVSSVAFTPDGKQIVSGSKDKTVGVWDLSGGKPARPFSKGHVGEVYGVAISPDGKRIVSASQDDTLKLWDRATGQEISTLSGHMQDVLCVAFGPHGEHLVSGGVDKTLRIWDAATGQELNALKGHTSYVRCVAFSPSGKLIASGGWDNSLKLWDATTGQELRTIHGHANVVSSVAFSPDEKEIVSGGWDSALKIWDVASGREIQSIKGNMGRVSRAVYSPGGQYIASACSDNINAATLSLFDAAREQAVFLEKPDGAPAPSGFFGATHVSADGGRIAGSVQTAAVVWDASDGSLISTFRDDAVKFPPLLAVSSDGQRIALRAPGNVLRLCDATNGHELRTIDTGFAPSVSFSPAGRWIVAGGATLKLWDAESGEEVRAFDGFAGSIQSVAFSRDGSRLAAISWGEQQHRELNVWESGTGLAVFKQVGSFSKLLAFSPEGQMIVTGNMLGGLRILDAADGREISAPRGHISVVTTAAFTADAKRLVTSGIQDGLKLWDANTGHQTFSFSNDSGKIDPLVFTNAGKLLIGYGLGLSDLQRGTTGGIRTWDARVPGHRPSGLPYDWFDRVVKQTGEQLRIASNQATLDFRLLRRTMGTSSPSALALWTENGRPAAVAQVRSHGPDGIQIAHEFQSLSPKRLVGEHDGRAFWTPAETPLDWRPVTTITNVDNSWDGRLAQMNELFRTISIPMASPSVQRLLIGGKPAYRYSEESGEVIDGALYIFSRGVVPVAILLLEARRHGQGFQWHYAVSRLTMKSVDTSYNNHDDPTQPYIQINGEFDDRLQRWQPGNIGSG